MAAGAPSAAAVPLVSGGFTLQLYQGPLVGETRYLGLGGAYTALADGINGLYSNVAAPGVRTPYSLSNFDYELNVGVSGPAAFGGIENLFTGKTLHIDDSLVPSIGLQLQYGMFGGAFNYRASSIKVQASSVNAEADAKLEQTVAAVGWSLVDGQLQAGVGLRSEVVTVTSGGMQAFSHDGVGGAFGVVFRPNEEQFRVGISYRFPIDIAGTDGAQAPGLAALPSRIWVPWEFEVGGAFQLGPRPLNPEWIDPDAQEQEARLSYQAARLERAYRYDQILEALPTSERSARRAELEKEEKTYVAAENRSLKQEAARLGELRLGRTRLWSRQGVLLLATLVVTGGASNSIGITDFIAQNNVASGAHTTFSPRIGAETEVIPFWLTARLGSYLEPSRSDGTSVSLHLTAGTDVVLGKFNPFGLLGEVPWCVRLGVDGAYRYFNWAISLGNYH